MLDIEDMGNTKNISRWSFERHETKPAPCTPSSAFCLVFIILAGCHLQILHGSHATGTFSGVFPITQTRGTFFPPSLHWAISGSLSVFRLFGERKVKLVLTFAFSLFLTSCCLKLSILVLPCAPLPVPCSFILCLYLYQHIKTNYNSRWTTTASHPFP